MLMTDVIVKKREGEKLSAEEIKFVVDGYTKGEIPDYQMSALLMAILLRGMDREETLELTMAMRDSGETLDLSAIKGVKADKHSTGGVGDKTSLILCPMVAAQGVKIAKMSGRGLELISLCMFHYSYSVEKINCFLQKRVSHFVYVAQFFLFCSRNLKTCRIAFAGILQFA